MTTPAPPPPPQQPYAPSQAPPPPSPLKAAAEAEMVTTTAGLLVTALGAGAVVAALVAKFRIQGDLRAGLYGSATIACSSPPPVTGIIGHASAQTSRQNLLRRAQFVVSAGKRLAGDIRQARAQGKPVRTALADGLARERRYYSLHLAAMWNRAAAAGKTDMAALEHGDLLSWNAVLDGKTSAECRAADGKNYHASVMPAIGYPGSVHPHCRCYPGPARPGAPLLPGRGSRYARAA
jgi:F like protein